MATIPLKGYISTVGGHGTGGDVGYGASCGGRVIYGLAEIDDIREHCAYKAHFQIAPGSQQKVLYPYSSQQAMWDGCTYIFSDWDQNGHGERIAKQIRDYDLGKMVQLGPHRNPNNPAHHIVFYMWTWNGKTGYEEEKKSNAA